MSFLHFTIITCYTFLMPKKRTNPTQKEWAFIKEYAIDFNGTEAYIRAFGATNRGNAARNATYYLKKEVVQNALNSYIQEQLGPQEKTLLGNVKFWTEIRDGVEDRKVVDIEHIKDMAIEYDISEDAVKAILEKAIQLPAHKTAERLKASEYLGKYQMMFVEKKEIQMEAQVQIVDDIK